MGRPRKMPLADAMAMIRERYQKNAPLTVTAAQRATCTSTADAAHLIRAVQIERGERDRADLDQLPEAIRQLVALPPPPPELGLLEADSEKIRQQVHAALAQAGTALEQLFARLQEACTAAVAAEQTHARERVLVIDAQAAADRAGYLEDNRMLQKQLRDAEGSLGEVQQAHGVLAERDKNAGRERERLKREVLTLQRQLKSVRAAHRTAEIELAMLCGEGGRTSAEPTAAQRGSGQQRGGGRR